MTGCGFFMAPPFLVGRMLSGFVKFVPALFGGGKIGEAQHHLGNACAGFSC